MKGQSRFFLTIAWNFKIKRFWHKLFASLKRKILTNESSLLQTFLLWVLYLGCGRNSRQKAGGERGALDKKLFLLQIVRYKVASVNKTVQTYQQGNFSTRHVKSLQTKLMSIMRAICSVKHLHRRNVNSYLWLSSLLERPVWPGYDEYSLLNLHSGFWLLVPYSENLLLDRVASNSNEDSDIPKCSIIEHRQ